MLDLLFIAVIVVAIVDISGVVDSIKSALKRWATGGRMSDPNYSLKPIDCSLCQTFWWGLLYLVLTHSLSLMMIAYLLGLCVMTPVIGSFIILVRETILKLIRRLS